MEGPRHRSLRLSDFLVPVGSLRRTENLLLAARKDSCQTGFFFPPLSMKSFFLCKFFRILRMESVRLLIPRVCSEPLGVCLS